MTTSESEVAAYDTANYYYYAAAKLRQVILSFAETIVTITKWEALMSSGGLFLSGFHVNYETL